MPGFVPVGELGKSGFIGFGLELEGLTNPGTTDSAVFSFECSNLNCGGLSVQNLAVVPKPTSPGLPMVGAVGVLGRRLRPNRSPRIAGMNQ